MNGDEQAALLTQAQRSYLRGEKEYRPSVERQVKLRIRNRVRAALVTDLPLLADVFDLEDLVGNTEIDWRSALRETVAFAVMAAEAADIDAEQVIDGGVEQAQNARAEAMLQKLEENPDAVTMNELKQLLAGQHVNMADIGEILVGQHKAEIARHQEQALDEARRDLHDEDGPEADE